jgi:3-methyladenine DNA glycosylase AlkD
MSLHQLIAEMDSLKSLNQATILQRFFKTGKGQYGEGDLFLGIKVPIQRSLSKKYTNLSLCDLEYLINSKIHEHRLISLFILILQFEKASQKRRQEIYEFYLKNAKNINNWDLVDLSAPKIPGAYLLSNDRSILHKLATSNNLWEKRIAIISTFAFIYKQEHEDTFKISELLLHDKHDLIHKAVGWMFREVGKRISEELECSFLDTHHKKMPRTMLRYAIERFEEKKRKHYLSLS